MSKSFILAAAACATLTGCQIFQKSPTWEKVVRTRIELPREGDTARIYAEGLHAELKAAGIERKVVTYQYRYGNGLREDAIAESTAVIYRDDSNPAHPWWIKDVKSGRPTWLPNASTQQQVRFYVGHEVQILESERGYGGEGKASVPLRKRQRTTQQAAAPDTSDSRALFRRTHGTAFNAQSAVDRAKMNSLLRTRNATASLGNF